MVTHLKYLKDSIFIDSFVIYARKSTRENGH